MAKQAISILGREAISGPNGIGELASSPTVCEFIELCTDGLLQWTKTLDSGTVASTAATLGGAVTITPASADNKVVNCVGPEMFQLQAGKPLEMEFKFGTQDVDDSGFFVGLCDSDTTLTGTTGVMAQNDHLGVLCGDGSASLTVNFVADDSGTAATLDSGVALVDAALHTYRMEYDGASTVHCYVDGAPVGTLTSSITNGVVMAPAIEFADRSAGSGGGLYMLLHYFVCVQAL